MAKEWQTCEARHHVGDEHDPTVAWHDRGLYCDTCVAALVDRRAIGITDEMVERAARAFEGDGPFERYDAQTRRESLDDARRALAAALHWKEEQ